MKRLQQAYLSGERALFKSRNLTIQDCIFADGESPLKESKNLQIMQSVFKWKYPLWYCQDVVMSNVTLCETARSGIWYMQNLHMEDSVIEAPKTFRRANDIYLKHVSMPNAQESFWNCRNIQLHDVNANGDYFGMNSEFITLDQVSLTGNYCFDGAKHIEVHQSKIIAKDAFWNCEDVTVYDSIIIGEYLGWNSKNITFVNCVIESLQGLCYIDNLKLENCKLLHTSLAFEYSSVDATIDSSIESIKNPLSGRIQAHTIEAVIQDDEDLDIQKVCLDMKKSQMRELG